eukprot:Amastigsp_a843561_125.p1 type:complete len:167 gc:universal Amastigsp_a843561_125:685-185(-)
MATPPQPANPQSSPQLPRSMDELFFAFEPLLRDSFEVLDLSLGHMDKFLFPGFVPAIDVTESAETIVVRAELPAVAKSDVHVELNSARNLLVISGHKPCPEPKSSEQRQSDASRTETRCGAFWRAVRVPFLTKPDGVRARLADGILTVNVAKPRDAPVDGVAITIE